MQYFKILPASIYWFWRNKGNLSLRATALAFNLILAIVPLMILAFSIVYFFKDIAATIVDVYIRSVVKIIFHDDKIYDFIIDMVMHASELNIYGLTGVFIAGLLFLINYNNAIRFVFESDSSHIQYDGDVCRFWTIITLVPILSIVSLYISNCVLCTVFITLFLIYRITFPKTVSNIDIAIGSLIVFLIAILVNIISYKIFNSNSSYTVIYTGIFKTLIFGMYSIYMDMLLYLYGVYLIVLLNQYRKDIPYDKNSI